MSKPAWIMGLCAVAALLLVSGCNLPYPGPYQGTVVDAETGEPIAGATVQGEWWCHDNPLPDGPGSFFVRSSTTTDEQGSFLLERETHRGGLFGASFALKITAEGYIPASLLGEPSGRPLPLSTQKYPFVQTVAYKEFPPVLKVTLSPAAAVYLEAMKSGIPLHQKVAREKLTKLLGVDYRYHAHKWERALQSGESAPPDEAEKKDTRKEKRCPCPDSVKKLRGNRPLQQKVSKLFRAALRGETAEVKRLLDSGVDTDIRDYSCRTALMWAAHAGSLEVIELLLSQGADVNARDKHCRTILMGASAWRTSPEVVDALLSHGADVNARDRDDRTPLMSAVSQYKSTDVVDAFLSHGADINAQDINGVSALMEASKFGLADTVRLLLERGADVHAKDKDGETAWFKASVMSQRDVVEVLESHGAGR